MLNILLHASRIVWCLICALWIFRGKERHAVLQVAFPLVLDTYEFCSEALKKQLDGPREAVRAAADRAAGLEKAAKVLPYPLCWEEPVNAKF